MKRGQRQPRANMCESLMATVPGLERNQKTKSSSSSPLRRPGRAGLWGDAGWREFLEVFGAASWLDQVFGASCNASWLLSCGTESIPQLHPRLCSETAAMTTTTTTSPENQKERDTKPKCEWQQRRLLWPRFERISGVQLHIATQELNLSTILRYLH